MVCIDFFNIKYLNGYVEEWIFRENDVPLVSSRCLIENLITHHNKKHGDEFLHNPHFQDTDPKKNFVKYEYDGSSKELSSQNRPYQISTNSKYTRSRNVEKLHTRIKENEVTIVGVGSCDSVRCSTMVSTPLKKRSHIVSNNFGVRKRKFVNNHQHDHSFKKFMSLEGMNSESSELLQFAVCCLLVVSKSCKSLLSWLEKFIQSLLQETPPIEVIDTLFNWKFCSMWISELIFISPYISNEVIVLFYELIQRYPQIEYNSLGLLQNMIMARPNFDRISLILDLFSTNTSKNFQVTTKCLIQLEQIYHFSHSQERLNTEYVSGVRNQEPNAPSIILNSQKHGISCRANFIKKHDSLYFRVLDEVFHIRTFNWENISREETHIWNCVMIKYWLYLLQDVQFSNIHLSEKDRKIRIRTICKQVDFYNQTPLHILSAQGALTPIVKYLVETEKLSLNQEDSSQLTPLHQACLAPDSYELVKYLLFRGAKSTSTTDGYTPLMLAASAGNFKSLFFLGNDQINRLSVDLSSALHFSAECGQPQAIKKLIESKANKNTLNSENLSPLTLALLEGHEECAYMLITSNCKLDCMLPPPYNSLCVLKFAWSIMRSEPITKCLVSRYTSEEFAHAMLPKLKLDMKDEREYNTMRSFLLENWTDIQTCILFRKSISILDCLDELFVSIQSLDIWKVKLFIQDASINSLTDLSNPIIEYLSRSDILHNGLNALLHAISTNSLKDVKYCITCGYDINYMKDNLSPLLLCSNDSISFEIFECITSHKSLDVTISDRFGSNALHMASEAGCFRRCRTLIQLQCPFTVNKFGETPVICACNTYSPNKEVIALLLETFFQEQCINAINNSQLIEASENEIKEAISQMHTNDPSSMDLQTIYESEDTLNDCKKEVTFTYNLDQKDIEGRTALWYSVFYGVTDIVRLLLDYNAKVTGEMLYISTFVHADKYLVKMLFEVASPDIIEEYSNIQFYTVLGQPDIAPFSDDKFAHSLCEKLSPSNRAMISVDYRDESAICIQRNNLQSVVESLSLKTASQPSNAEDVSISLSAWEYEGSESISTSSPVTKYVMEALQNATVETLHMLLVEYHCLWNQLHNQDPIWNLLHAKDDILKKHYTFQNMMTRYGMDGYSYLDAVVYEPKSYNDPKTFFHACARENNVVAATFLQELGWKICSTKNWVSIMVEACKYDSIDFYVYLQERILTIEKSLDTELLLFEALRNGASNIVKRILEEKQENLCIDYSHVCAAAMSGNQTTILQFFPNIKIGFQRLLFYKLIEYGRSDCIEKLLQFKDTISIFQLTLQSTPHSRQYFENQSTNATNFANELISDALQNEFATIYSTIATSSSTNMEQLIHSLQPLLVWIQNMKHETNELATTIHSEDIEQDAPPQYVTPNTLSVSQEPHWMQIAAYFGNISMIDLLFHHSTSLQRQNLRFIVPSRRKCNELKKILQKHGMHSPKIRVGFPLQDDSF